MFNFLRDKKFYLFLLIAIPVFALAFFMYKIDQRLNKLESSISITKATTENISIDGTQSTSSDPKVIYVQGNNTHTKEIVYVNKEVDPATGEKEKTDIQLDTQKSIYFRINDNMYEFPTLSTEDSKFENGKLVITDESISNINITSPKPSKIELGILINSDKKVAGNIDYNFTRAFAFTVMAGEDMKPYYGVKFKIGDFLSR